MFVGPREGAPTGTGKPGKDLTLVGVGSPHRAEALRALSGRKMWSLLWKETEDK